MCEEETDDCALRMSVTKSDSGWALTETIHELVKSIEMSVEQNTNWILALVADPTHISEETRERFENEHPFLTHCFEEPSQPASSLVPCKTDRLVLDMHDAVGQMVKQVKLKTELRVHLDVPLNEVHTEATHNIKPRTRVRVAFSDVHAHVDAQVHEHEDGDVVKKNVNKEMFMRMLKQM